MKKLLGIVVLGLMLVGCSTTSSVVSTDKLKQDMTKSELNELFLIYSPTIISSNQAGDDGQVPGSAQIQNRKNSQTLSLGQEFLQSEFL